MIDWTITIIVGLLVGSAIGYLLRGTERLSLPANIVIGLTGGLLGRWFFVDILGIGIGTTPVAFDFLAALWSLVGSVVIVGIINGLTPIEIGEQLAQQRSYAQIYKHEIKDDDDDEE